MEWQPIETVPKDGSAVLVFLKEEHFHSHVHAATFHPNIGVIGGSFAFDCPHATHWMQLPEAPSAGLIDKAKEAE